MLRAQPNSPTFRLQVSWWSRTLVPLFFVVIGHWMRVVMLRVYIYIYVSSTLSQHQAPSLFSGVPRSCYEEALTVQPRPSAQLSLGHGSRPSTALWPVPGGHASGGCGLFGFWLKSLTIAPKSPPPEVGTPKQGGEGVEVGARC